MAVIEDFLRNEIGNNAILADILNVPSKSKMILKQGASFGSLSLLILK